MARPASTLRNLTKTLIQLIIMWLIFLFLGPVSLYRFEDHLHLARFRFASRGWRTAGAFLFAAGATLGCLSAIFMVVKGQGTPLPADCPRRLVIAGPYRYVRNPMAMGSFAQGIAVGLYLGSPLATAYAIIGSIGWNYVVRPWEETDLQRRFGAPYERYRDSVRCWIPTVRPYVAQPEE